MAVGKSCKYCSKPWRIDRTLICIQGLLTKTSDGEEYFGYGGDFGDSPNDGAVMINGILNSDHKPAPSFSVFQKAIEPVKVAEYGLGLVTIMNRYDFLTLDHLQLHWSLTEENQPEGPRWEVSIPLGKPSLLLCYILIF